MMKKIEYFLNMVHYGVYLFHSKIDVNPDHKDEMFISRGIGLWFVGGINLILFSICLIINKIIGVYKNISFGVFMFLMIVAYGINYYFIDRKDKHLIYAKEFEKEGKPWKYILISFGFMIAYILFFIFSLKVAV
jgi:hypothetical protein